MLIRDMTPEDVDDVLKIEQACFHVPWTRNMFLEELAQDISVYRVVEIDGTPVAYMGMYQVADEGHITNVAVMPDYQRRGIANSLIREFVDIAQERRLCLLTLEVRVGNSGAIRLYEKHGFTRVGVRPRYYENSEDALLMTRYFEQGE